jgi:hypothetical protein
VRAVDGDVLNRARSMAHSVNGASIRFCLQRAAYAIDANTVIGGASGHDHPPRGPEPGRRRRVNAAALPDDYMARTRPAADRDYGRKP